MKKVNLTCRGEACPRPYFKVGILIFVLFLTVPHFSIAQQQSKPNILFLAIDDLKPLLGCYGDKLAKTPNIDRLARKGTLFANNYCQQAVCGPTRASLMTGMRPDYTKVWDLKTPMRNVTPNLISLPQYLITQGYSTQGIGKVYDPRNVDKDLDKPSWSVPYYKTKKKYYATSTGEPIFGHYQRKNTRALGEKFIAEGIAKGMSQADAVEYASTKVKPSVESADVPDNAYNDGANVYQAKDILKQLSQIAEPFFFAVGIAKPHLPFVAPKKYWDLYKREEMPIAPFQQQSKDAVQMAYHTGAEIKAYSDIPPLLSFTDQKPYGLTLPIDKQKELIHGYYASVSYMDALVGELLNTIDSLGLSKNTIFVLWGDHGWHLGDHNLWCKHTNFEQATHSPLIISSPQLAPSKTHSMTEFIDIFPTLCDLAGVPIPRHLAGKSLKPLMKDPKQKVKDFSMSQYPRSNATTVENDRLGYSEGKIMGYSLRTDRYRYTLWMKDNFRSTQTFKKELIAGVELYDYKKDPNETANVANDKKYATVAKDLNDKMVGFFKSAETH